MNFVLKSKELFKAEKPEHFTDFRHCEECNEHDCTLLSHDIDTIGLAELGNPGCDPLCFSSADGLKYYIPALIRLSLETIDNKFYLGQFLFHLEGDGHSNGLWLACNAKQRDFIARFLQQILDNHLDAVELNCYSKELLRCYEIWSKI
jgi:hypothetical protein